MVNKRKVYAVLLAAGKGSRMKSKKKKQFMELEGREIFEYSLISFLLDPSIDKVYIVSDLEGAEHIKDRLSNDSLYLENENRIRYAVGGSERYISVYNAIKAISLNEEACSDALILIHDGARPFLKAEMISRSIKDTLTYGSSVMAVPLKDTVKFVDKEGFALSTPDRSSLMAVQTPQSFIFSEIKAAYMSLFSLEDKKREEMKITDDAMLMETFGKRKVYLSEGDYSNIKITDQGDLKLAKLYMDI